MTHDPERQQGDDIEDALKQFRPVGPPADLRGRVLGAARGPAPARRFTRRRVAFVGGAVAAAAIVAMQFRSEPTRPQQGFVRMISGGGGSPASALTSGERATFQAAWVKESRVDLGIPADGATVLVVEYTDFLCPQCEGIRRASREVMPAYLTSGRVKYVVADWPSDTSCNKRLSIASTLRPRPRRSCGSQGTAARPKRWKTGCLPIATESQRRDRRRKLSSTLARPT
jgi:hypothetical protein